VNRSVAAPRFDVWTAIALVLAAATLAPILVVTANLLRPSQGIWSHLAATTLPVLVINTALLMLGVGLSTAIIGTGTAWLTTMCRFPGRKLLTWLLVMPLAMPAYIVAYVVTDMLQFAGPVQSALRAGFGWGRGDYWFPDIHSLSGCVAMLALVLYPYVYLLARAAFLEQSTAALEAGRMLGRGPWANFFGVALPLARPAIAGGTALALMETLGDFGAVQFFGVDTFTTAIYRTWFGMGNQVAAAQLAAALMGFVLLALALEQLSRGGRRYHQGARRQRPPQALELAGVRAWAAALACFLPPALGFLLPLGRLAVLAAGEDGGPSAGRLAGFAANSLTLAASAALATLIVALALGYAVRLRASPLLQGLGRLAGLGYAVPGSVIAVGMLMPLAAIDNAVDRAMREAFGISTGLLLSGTILALLVAYVVRFLALAQSAVEAGLGRITPRMDEAARLSGAPPFETLRRIHLPILRPSLLVALLAVFVDVLKELPATLIVRPFNFDTLAVRVYQLASDERLGEASLGALAIVAAGLVPVTILAATLTRRR